MPEPNLRDLVGDIREALEKHTKESLIEILTYVFKEYVVQGPAPLATSAPPLRDDLEGMSFAEVIRSLQLRLDLPELALFEVQGDRVTVKVGGRPMPVDTQQSRPEPLAAAPPPAPMAAPTPPTPPPQAAPQPAASPQSPQSPMMTTSTTSVPARPAQAPAATPGTSREELPAAARPAAAAQPAQGGQARPAAQPAQPQGKAQPPAKEEGGDNAGRFNLLEID